MVKAHIKIIKIVHLYEHKRYL